MVYDIYVSHDVIRALCLVVFDKSPLARASLTSHAYRVCEPACWAHPRMRKPCAEKVLHIQPCLDWKTTLGHAIIRSTMLHMFAFSDPNSEVV